MENMRGKRAERCVSANDKEVMLINKELEKTFYGFYINTFNKVYWIDDEFNVVWLKEDRYPLYEIKEVV